MNPGLGRERESKKYNHFNAPFLTCSSIEAPLPLAPPSPSLAPLEDDSEGDFASEKKRRGEEQK